MQRRSYKGSGSGLPPSPPVPLFQRWGETGGRNLLMFFIYDIKYTTESVSFKLSWNAWNSILQTLKKDWTAWRFVPPLTCLGLLQYYAPDVMLCRCCTNDTLTNWSKFTSPITKYSSISLPTLACEPSFFFINTNTIVFTWFNFARLN